MRSRMLASISALLAMVLVCLTLAPSATTAQNGTVQQDNATSIYLPLIATAAEVPPTQPVTYDVTYTPDTVVIDDATIDSALLSISDDQTEIRFDASASQVSQLQSGQVLLLAGTALRKVQSVSTVGNEIVVMTEGATLDEAIQEGDIGWDYQADWDALPLEVYMAAQFGTEDAPLLFADARGFDPLTGQATPQAEVSYEGEIRGWDVTLKLTPGTRLDIELTAKRKVGSAQATINGTGWVNSFQQTTFLTYEQSTPTRMTVETTGMEGEFEITWGAASPGIESLTQVVQFSIPAQIPIPLRVGPLPISLRVKAELQIVPELRVDQASSVGSFKVSYNSDQGFQINNNTPAPSGSLGQHNIGITDDTVSAGFGAVGLGVGVEFPRVELVFFNTPLAFITLKTYSYGLYIPDPPCQRGGTNFLSVAGYRLAFLGFTLSEGQTELWREDFVRDLEGSQCGSLALSEAAAAGSLERLLPGRETLSVAPLPAAVP